MDEDDYPIHLGTEVYQSILDTYDEECESKIIDLTDEDLGFLNNN